MTKKAKRIIKEFDFESEGASVHLVSKEQGGAANGFKTLITKSNATEHLPDVEQDINIKKKLEQVKVTMSMEEFLRKFFDMYYYDAELLTAMLGFETESENSSKTSEPFDYSSYLQEQVSGFEIMKSMHEQNYENVSASDIVTILEFQEQIEKKLNEEMMDKITIEKSRFSELEQAEIQLQEKIEIEKSLEEKVSSLTQELESIKKAQADAELQAMQSTLKDLIEEEKIENMAKSLLAMDEDARNTMIEALTSKKENIEKSALFEEQSIDSEGEPELTKEQKFEDSLVKSLSQQS